MQQICANENEKQLTKLRENKQQKQAKNVHVSFPMPRLEFFDVIG